MIFNEGNTLPNASEAAETLVEAVSNPNFSLPVNTSSITATGKLFGFFSDFEHFIISIYIIYAKTKS